MLLQYKTHGSVESAVETFVTSCVLESISRYCVSLMRRYCELSRKYPDSILIQKSWETQLWWVSDFASETWVWGSWRPGFVQRMTHYARKQARTQIAICFITFQPDVGYNVRQTEKDNLARIQYINFKISCTKHTTTEW